MVSGRGRCWVVYNDVLIGCVMLLFSFDCLDSRGDELRSMNVGKVGAPFKYPSNWSRRNTRKGGVRDMAVDGWLNQHSHQ